MAKTSPPKPGAGHKRLQAFVGKWKSTGRQHAGPVGPAMNITAVETFEWLEGGFFLVHRFDGRVGKDDAGCIEIIGYDTRSRSYPARTYYNNGVVNDWKYTQRKRAWTVTGNWNLMGKKVKVRCTIVFSDRGKTRTGKWESSRDGAKWTTFWDVTSRKR